MGLPTSKQQLLEDRGPSVYFLEMSRKVWFALVGTAQLLCFQSTNEPGSSFVSFHTYLKVLPLVLELGQDIIWRVRRAVMVSVPLLTERMGVNYFEENLLELYLQVRAQKAKLFFVPKRQQSTSDVWKIVRGACCRRTSSPSPSQTAGTKFAVVVVCLSLVFDVYI